MSQVIASIKGMGKNGSVTVKDLRNECKARKLKGYSSLKRFELIKLLETGNVPAPEKDSTRWYKQEARRIGKSKGHNTYFLRVAETKAYVESGGADKPVKPEPKTGTAAYYKALLTQHKISGRSKATKKADMIALLEKNGIAI